MRRSAAMGMLFYASWSSVGWAAEPRLDLSNRLDFTVSPEDLRATNLIWPTNWRIARLSKPGESCTQRSTQQTPCIRFTTLRFGETLTIERQPTNGTDTTQEPARRLTLPPPSSLDTRATPTVGSLCLNPKTSDGWIEVAANAPSLPAGTVCYDDDGYHVITTGKPIELTRGTSTVSVPELHLTGKGDQKVTFLLPGRTDGVLDLELFPTGGSTPFRCQKAVVQGSATVSASETGGCQHLFTLGGDVQRIAYTFRQPALEDAWKKFVAAEVELEKAKEDKKTAEKAKDTADKAAEKATEALTKAVADKKDASSAVTAFKTTALTAATKEAELDTATKTIALKEKALADARARVGSAGVPATDQGTLVLQRASVSLPVHLARLDGPSPESPATTLARPLGLDLQADSAAILWLGRWYDAPKATPSMNKVLTLRLTADRDASQDFDVSALGARFAGWLSGTDPAAPPLIRVRGSNAAGGPEEVIEIAPIPAPRSTMQGTVQIRPRSTQVVVPTSLLMTGRVAFTGLPQGLYRLHDVSNQPGAWACELRVGPSGTTVVTDAWQSDASSAFECAPFFVAMGGGAEVNGDPEPVLARLSAADGDSSLRLPLELRREEAERRSDLVVRQTKEDLTSRSSRRTLFQVENEEPLTDLRFRLDDGRWMPLSRDLFQGSRKRRPQADRPESLYAHLTQHGLPALFAKDDKGHYRFRAAIEAFKEVMARLGACEDSHGGYSDAAAEAFYDGPYRAVASQCDSADCKVTILKDPNGMLGTSDCAVPALSTVDKGLWRLTEVEYVPSSQSLQLWPLDASGSRPPNPVSYNNAPTDPEKLATAAEATACTTCNTALECAIAMVKSTGPELVTYAASPGSSDKRIRIVQDGLLLHTVPEEEDENAGMGGWYLALRRPDAYPTTQEEVVAKLRDAGSATAIQDSLTKPPSLSLEALLPTVADTSDLLRAWVAGQLSTPLEIRSTVLESSGHRIDVAWRMPVREPLPGAPWCKAPLQPASAYLVCVDATEGSFDVVYQGMVEKYGRRGIFQNLSVPSNTPTRVVLRHPEDRAYAFKADGEVGLGGAPVDEEHTEGDALPPKLDATGVDSLAPAGTSTATARTSSRWFSPRISSRSSKAFTIAIQEIAKADGSAASNSVRLEVPLYRRYFGALRLGIGGIATVGAFDYEVAQGEGRPNVITASPRVFSADLMFGYTQFFEPGGRTYLDTEGPRLVRPGLYMGIGLVGVDNNGGISPLSNAMVGLDLELGRHVSLVLGVGAAQVRSLAGGLQTGSLAPPGTYPDDTQKLTHPSWAFGGGLVLNFTPSFFRLSGLSAGLKVQSSNTGSGQGSKP